ncbi:MAG: hypothetical protein FJW83_01420 [Actinobacteria bacterium]|nr:hypothetical protein [Actinomycetota bacterium]
MNARWPRRGGTGNNEGKPFPRRGPRGTRSTGSGTARPPWRWITRKRKIAAAAGGGNGGDTETWKAATEKSYLSDCLDKAFKSRYTAEEATAILAQANCDHWGPWIICEVDPGNSATHNSAPGDDDR